MQQGDTVIRTFICVRLKIGLKEAQIYKSWSMKRQKCFLRKKAQGSLITEDSHI